MEVPNSPQKLLAKANVTIYRIESCMHYDLLMQARSEGKADFRSARSVNVYLKFDFLIISHSNRTTRKPLDNRRERNHFIHGIFDGGSPVIKKFRSMYLRVPDDDSLSEIPESIVPQGADPSASISASPLGPFLAAAVRLASARVSASTVPVRRLSLDVRRELGFLAAGCCCCCCCCCCCPKVDMATGGGEGGGTGEGDGSRGLLLPLATVA